MWVRNLSNSLKYNGSTGVICDGPIHDGMTHVNVRLDEDNHGLRLKLENVFVQDNIPVFTANSPKFMDPTHRIMSEHKTLFQEKEFGKGDGMKTLCSLVKGDRIVKRDDQTQVVLVMPSIEGCSYAMPVGTATSPTLNRPLCQDEQIQEWIDVIYFHYQDTDRVCTMENRYIGGLCGLGGCGKCGLSSLTLAALKYAKVEDMNNPDDVFNGWAGDLLVDTEQILGNLQITEILLVVNFILTHTRDTCPRVRRDFALYTWKRIGVWKVNGISGYMPLETLEEVLDPRLVQLKKDTTSHMKSWTDAMQEMLADLQTSGVETTPEMEKNGLLYAVRVKKALKFLEENKLPHRKVQGNVVGHAVLAVLYQSYISKINGAKQGDVVNCSFKNYFHCPQGSVDVERDLRNFICIEEDIPAGEFMCVAYNPSELPDYFQRLPGRSLQEQVMDSSVLAAVAQSVVEQYSECLPEYVVAYLEMAQQRRESGKKQRRTELP